MKRITLVVIVATMTVFAVVAQSTGADNRKPSFEQFLKEKTSFIVREMKLPAQDSVAFVPIYVELQTKKAELFKKYSEASRTLRRQLKHKGGQVDDALYLRAVEDDAQMNVDDARLEQEYIARFKQVLSPRQLFDYVKAEKKFKARFMSPRDKRNDERNKH